MSRILTALSHDNTCLFFHYEDIFIHLKLSFLHYLNCRIFPLAYWQKNTYISEHLSKSNVLEQIACLQL